MRESIVRWNNMFAHDLWFRRKFNIPFNSEKHREMSQIDISFMYYEDVIIEEQREKDLEDLRRKENFEKTGNWLSNSENKSAEDNLFDKIKF